MRRAAKRWPESYFASTVAAIQGHGVEVVLIGGAEDRDLCTRISASATNLAGTTTLRESAAVLERAAVLLSNDSAPMHLGVVAGIPVVAVYCSTIPEFGFAPLGPRDIVLEVPGLDCRPCGSHGHQICPKNNFHCGEQLAVETVVSAIKERLDENVIP